MARGYSEEADRILNYLVSAYMRCPKLLLHEFDVRNMEFLMRLESNTSVASFLGSIW